MLNYFAQNKMCLVVSRNITEIGIGIRQSRRRLKGSKGNDKYLGTGIRIVEDGVKAKLVKGWEGTSFSSLLALVGRAPRSPVTSAGSPGWDTGTQALTFAFSLRPPSSKLPLLRARMWLRIKVATLPGAKPETRLHSHLLRRCIGNDFATH